MLTNDLREKLDTYRRKVIDNTITKEELIEAVHLMREGRVAAARTSAASRSRKTTEKKTVDSDALLDDFIN